MEHLIQPFEKASIMYFSLSYFHYERVNISDIHKNIKQDCIYMLFYYSKTGNLVDS